MLKLHMMFSLYKNYPSSASKKFSFVNFPHELRLIYLFILYFDTIQYTAYITHILHHIPHILHQSIIWWIILHLPHNISWSIHVVLNKFICQWHSSTLKHQPHLKRLKRVMTQGRLIIQLHHCGVLFFASG